jgi:hypothetical protein
VPPPGGWATRPLSEPSLRIRIADAREIAGLWSGLEDIAWQASIDGAPLVVERGVAGDHRFVHGAAPAESGAPSERTLAIHHLSADASVLSCAPSRPADPSWWRLVLDSVLFTVALLRGYEALHAGALATGEGTIAIAAGTGGGKSTLLVELLGRGLALMADDVLVLRLRGGNAPVSHPGPPVMTIPCKAMPALREAEQPHTIASIGDERWVAVPTYPDPLPLKALVLLDRKPGVERHPSLSRIESPLALLLSAFIDFPLGPDRQRARFELASAIAGTAGLWRLTASLDTPASALADTLLAGAL